jgi:hypothetical protein
MTRYDPHLGDSDPGTGLRASMNASVSGIRMPAGLLDRAVSRNRKRQARNRLTGAVGAVAAVAAAAAVIAAVPGGPSGRPALSQQTAGQQAQTAAYVLNRAAAAQVNSYRMISVDRETGSGGVTFYTYVATHQQRIVQSNLQIAIGTVGGVTRETDVEYRHHVYSTFTPSDDRHGGAMTDPSTVLPGQVNQDPVAAFHQALKAGVITVVGHRSLNGRDTILLRVSAAYNLKRAGVRPGAAVPGDASSWIWIDATTYLVVQTKNFQLYRPGLPPVVDHLTWLSPTPGNLALLTVTPPAGFTKIPYSKMAQILKPLS